MSVPSVVRARSRSRAVPQGHVSKAGGDADSILTSLLNAANRLTGPLRAAFLESLQRMAEGAPEALWDRAYQSGDIAPLVNFVLDQLAGGGRLDDQLRRVLQDSMRRTRAWAPVPQTDLDTPNPLAVASLQEYRAPLVRQLSDEVRGVIADIVADGIAAGIAPRAMGALVTRAKGFSLTRRQWGAVWRYRNELQENLLAPQRRRALRDRRFAVRADLTEAEIEQRVARYGERFLRYRADMITRTETIRALNTGLWLTTHYAAEDGLLDRDRLVRRWIPAPDNATGGGACPVCLDIALRNEAGVGFDEPFRLDDEGGEIMQPPAHPHCRCVVFTRPRIGDETFTLANAYLPPDLRRTD